MIRDDGRSGSAEFRAAVRSTEGLQPWRRLFHMGAGVGIAAFAVVVGPDSPVPAATLGGALAAALALDWIRLRSRVANTVFFRWFSALASPREAGKVASSTWYLLGVLAVLVIAPAGWFASAVLVLALADPAASVVGRLWGRHGLGKGSWEGTAAFFLVAAAVLAPLAGLQAALIAAALVAALEVLPTGIDDNLTVPLATVVALWLVGAPS
ncbi:MAG: hypothetical protein OXQ94_01210 [Gemmatimonadota bacterium]|nr:hypothetical protein [Gemmatimonadota bacterium]MDE2870297.1 hypothetical protein [Gemmatimonadota bacterium]